MFAYLSVYVCLITWPNLFFPWGPLASKNCCVIWIFAYLLDSLCFSKHSLRKLSIHFFIWLTYSLTYGKFVYLQVAYIWTCNAFEAHAWVEVSSSMYIFNTFIDTVSVFYSKIINLFFVNWSKPLLRENCAWNIPKAFYDFKNQANPFMFSFEKIANLQ